VHSFVNASADVNSCLADGECFLELACQLPDRPDVRDRVANHFCAAMPVYRCSRRQLAVGRQNVAVMKYACCRLLLGLVTSVKEVMFSPVSVCSFVIVARYSASE